MIPSLRTLLCTLIVIVCAGMSSAQDCQAAFTFDGTDITIQFMDQSTSAAGDPIVSWSWDFDDNATSNQQNPTHTFSDPDKYDVTLTITTANGCTSTITVQIEMCVLPTNLSIGSCDQNGMVQLTINVSDVYDNGKDIDISVDGQLLPGSPFEIQVDQPVTTTYTMPGDGLSHTLVVQSTDIGTCNTTVEFTVPDCSSDCFLSSFAVNVLGGSTHNVDVGDNFFSPVNTTITLGDIVHFQWVGDGHTTTSDATSGPDSWNSGELGFGASYDVSIQNPGVHPYYCIPHGGPGGAGMSGSIVANCPPSNQFTLNLTFNTTIADPAGYNVLVDGVVQGGSPFTYNGTGPQSASVSLNGDGQPHIIEIQDVADPTCVLTNNWMAPDCGAAPACSLSLSGTQVGACSPSNTVSVELTVNAINGGAAGFTVLVDGNATAGSPFNYNPSGVTVVTIDVPGDGQTHTITATDVNDSSCTTNTNITTTDCTIQCSLTNLTATTGSSVVHVVEVRDFEFVPPQITIASGDIVEWQWTGVVDHTTTSDATSGPDSWDSGLLNQGGTFQKPGLSVGVHPYYCIPHGAPGGVGMAGTVTVQASCTNNMVPVALSFNETGGSFDGFQVLVDGNPAGTFSYDPSGSNIVSVNVPGDGGNHTIIVQDLADAGCTVSTTIATPDCNASTCQLTLSAQEAGGCNASDNVPVELTVGDAGGGASGFQVLVDGQPAGTFNYSGTGTTVVTIDVTGDAQNHIIEVIDIADPSCSASANLTTTNCTIPCSITNLQASTGSSTVHVVEVIDFEFVPQAITITSGDIIEWQWTGAVAHTSTSDATSGPDSWDSGLLGQGATYQSPVLSAGVHPYYCVPHGAPGGVGMAGTITVQADCTNGNVSVNLSFDAQGGGFGGYRVTVDGQQVGTYDYDPGGSNSVAITVAGDGQSHTITVEDIDDPGCLAVTTLTTPDCNAPTCQLTLSGQETGSCNGGNVPVELTVSDVGGGASGFQVLVDGQSAGTFNYSGTGTTVVSVDVTGDGQLHTIEVVDVAEPSCSAQISLTTTDCTIPCSISNLQASTGSSTVHVVEVIDFEFVPQAITITSGDIIEWQWTGAVAHTSTSDATSGPDSWDSGLLGQGATYQSPVLSAGVHPYYCVPHGAPGGVGMAGTITVQADCTNGNVSVNLSFDAQGGGFGGYRVTVDGQQVGTYDYDPSGSNSVAITVAGDGQSHTITVEDIDDPGCLAVTTLTTPDCNAPTCQLTLSGQETGSCNGGNVPVELTVSDVGGGASGFQVLVDGQSAGTFNYSGTGTTVVSVDVTGDGQLHNLEVVDVAEPGCSAQISLTTTDCTIPCSITNLQASTGSSTVHVVEVIDFEFVPQAITITSGDIIEWQWTGAVAHTSTSDATSGPDSWDSGLLGQGATYQSPVLSAGVHPYYCVPHGAPGGVGMAGTITVQADCTNGNVSVNLSFDAQGGGFGGYRVTVDGQQVGTYDYDPSGSNSVAITVAGDGQSHTITVEDIDDPSCLAVTTLTTPDCNAPTCQLTLSGQETGSCNGGNVPVELTVSDVGGGASGFQVLVDGQSAGTFNYSGTGTTVVSVDVTGDGQLHTIEVVDVAEPGCSAQISLTTTDCTIPCSISNLQASTGSSTVHVVEVIDFEFVPQAITITSGDIIEWQWTGAVAHTSTSDATSGPDSWDSGLLGQGATYQSPVLSAGVHPYYCVPHGAPGGVGMAGTITVQADCTNGNVSVNLSFDAQGGGFGGYRVTVDGQQVGTYDYDPSGSNSVAITVAGDGQSHTITVEDIDDPGCLAVTTLTTPDCNAPTCQLTLSGQETGSCNGGNVPVELTVSDVGGGTSGFEVLVDGQSAGNFNYSGTGTTVVSVDVTGDGQLHTIEVVDVAEPSCSAQISLTTTDCTIPCSISNLQASTGSSTVHVVEVIDFEFVPQAITITSGDIIEWQWTGAVAHTSTSDATSGPDSWDSGLLGQGATYQSPVLSAGVHPYYCVPHGAPGGVGMAGTITVQADCTNGNVSVNLSFDAAGVGFSGFEVLIDSTPAGTFNYSGTGTNSLSIAVPGDGQPHTITVQDLDNPDCSATTTISTPDCNAPTCQLSVSGEESGACDPNDEVPVSLTINDVGGGAAGFEIMLDGQSVGTYNYSGTGTTTLSINAPGDGQAHAIEVIDLAEPTCTATFSITTTNCIIPCTISDLVLSTGSSTTHTVEVRDFEFVPQNIVIREGDIVAFVWTGAVAHTATSDAAAGPDSFDSGLLGQGATFSVQALNLGTHPYYCIPHGAPGGVGMAGTITVLPDCDDNDEVAVQLNFSESGGSFNGYQLLLDGNVYGQYTYADGGNNSISINVAGDNQSHTIVIEDIDDPSCSATASITTPDCSFTLPCELNVMVAQSGNCNVGEEVKVSLTVVSANTGDQGFNLLVDGALWPASPYTYDPSGTTSFDIDLNGDGLNHTFEVIDVSLTDCSASTSLVLDDCALPCALSALQLETATGGGGTTHIVEVKDFEFVPRDIEIELGDIVRWEWTGVIAHTATSDADSGVDSWDSGLLGQGASYELTLQTEGFHPYYCIPHGTPGGVGMAGTITVNPPGAACENGMTEVLISFEATNPGANGFRVLVDGSDSGTFDYSADVQQNLSLSLPGDGQSHIVRIEDVDNSDCAIEGTIVLPDCSEPAPCALSISNVQTTDCNDDNDVEVSFQLDYSDTGTSGYEVFINGQQQSGGPFAYGGTGSDLISLILSGTGQDQTIEIQDADSTNCSAIISVNTPLCGAVCEILDLAVTTGPTKHIVEVRDYEFAPKNLDIVLGDTVEFIWTGVIPHTTTSDATSGPNSWDSELLGQGASYQIILDEAGAHPYYCIPHGGPGGIGMAGIINVQEDCTDGEAFVNVSFTTTNGSNQGYNVFVDGQQVAGPIAYDDPMGSNNTQISLPGDGDNHTITVQDLDVSFCAASVNFTAPECPILCEVIDLQASLGNDIVHIIEVRDFEFVPANITVRTGETVRFVWTGEIPHSVTSDASSGTDSWDSGIIGQGSVFELVIQNTGEHPYYCTPHGGPGGIGMSGTITALDDCENDLVDVQLSFSITSGSALGYNVFVDGSQYNTEPIAYDDPMGQNTTTVSIAGDGANHFFTVQDLETGFCAATVQASVPDCNATCSIQDLSLSFMEPQRHTVEVFDFGYAPQHLEINLGDTVEFVWTGVIAHTVTSDASSGPDSFDSDLLDQGATYELVLTTEGYHPYYCIPHGGPGGIGMAGSITVVNTNCENGMVNAMLQFNAVATGGLGYNLSVDGQVTDDSPYNYAPDGQNTLHFLLPGDGQLHTLIVSDAENMACADTIQVQTANCNMDCVLSMSTAQVGECTAEGTIDYTITLSGENTGGSFALILDGASVPGSPFDYDASGSTTVTVVVPGDGQPHELQAMDSDSLSCVANLTLTPPDCTPDCLLSLQSALLEGCDENRNVSYRLSISAENAGDSGFNVSVNGSDLPGSPFAYTGPMTLIELELEGNGQSYTIIVTDVEFSDCIATITIEVPDCSQECLLSQLEIDVDVPEVHIVEVLDFDYSPRDLTISLGDTVRFVWTGAIPHTVTSDATSGTDVWNSGLLGQGAVYDLVINTAGFHPYYCIPHGSPGGVGMAGTITVEDTCEDGMLAVAFSFQTENAGDSGFNVYLNGALDAGSPFNYEPDGSGQLVLDVPADGSMHLIQFQDIAFPDCTLDSLFQMPDCSDPCFGFDAKFDFEVDYTTNTVVLTSTTNGATAWNWDFGDGNTGEGEQVTYTFEQAGTYTICHTATNEECSDDICITLTFEEVFCEANFEYTTNGLTLSFSDLSSTTDTIQAWTWTIDGNTIAEQNPTYTFGALGMYEVCLLIETANCSADTCMILDLTDPCLPLVAGFSYELDMENLSVQFTDLTGGQPNQWLWGFGDGNTSNSQHPQHFYDGPGDYTVCLLAQDTESSCNATHCEVIRVGMVSDITLIERNKELLVFPNPASVHQQTWTMRGLLDQDYLQIMPFKLYDVQGKTILETSLQGREEVVFSIPQPLSEGVYFLELRSENAIYRAKLIIQ